MELRYLKNSEIRVGYGMRLDKQLQEEKTDEWMDIDEMWNKLKEGIEMAADEICGKDQLPNKQNWMNSAILRKMEERRKCKKQEKEGQYKTLKH